MPDITYQDKDNQAQDETRKWRDADANEVKTVVNQKQDKHVNLTSLSNIVGNGFVKKTGPGAFTTDDNPSLSTAQNTEVATQITTAVDALKAGVPVAGDTLKKLYDLIIGIGQFAGSHDASTGLLPTVGTGSGGNIDKGDFWRVSVAGTIIGLGTFKQGDVIYSSIDNALVASDFFGVENNQDLATPLIMGLVKLYTDLTSSNTDGTVTQAVVKALSDAAEKLANKGVANGYPSLDANAKIPIAQMNDQVNQATQHYMFNNFK
jgi:hypothetical protein